MREDYDEKVVEAFLRNHRMMDVIRESGISKNRAYRFKNDPDFMEYVRKRKEELIQAAVNRMVATMVNDADQLQEIINDPETAPQVRINAIQLKWNQLREWNTVTDILERLDALERPLKSEKETA